MYNFTTPAAMFRELSVDRINTLTISNVFVGSMPESPDDIVCFYDTGGGQTDSRIAIDTHSIQIRSRGSYGKAYAILNEIKLQIESIDSFYLNDNTKLIGVWIRSNIASIGRDDQNRSIFTLNFVIKTQPFDNGNRDFNSHGMPTSTPNITTMTETDIDGLPFLP